MNEIEALKDELKQTQLAYQMAAQMSQFKAGFLGRSSHELRSPLSSLIGLIQLILSDLCENPEEEREFINQAYHSALKLMKLIDEIIAVSKVDYGTIPLEVEPLNLEEIFDNLFHLTHLIATNRNLELKISPPDPSIHVMADRGRLLQLLVNLVDTAISSLEQGSIKVSANVSTGEGLVYIEIDTQCRASIWNEPIDLLQTIPEATPEDVKSFGKQFAFSPGMKLMLSMTLLETMEGGLEVLDLSGEEGSEPLTRLKCWLPLADLESFPGMLGGD